MRPLIPSPLWRMNMAFRTPRRSARLLPARLICEPGGSRKGKKNGASSIMKQHVLNLKMGWIRGVGWLGCRHRNEPLVGRWGRLAEHHSFSDCRRSRAAPSIVQRPPVAAQHSAAERGRGRRR